MKHPRFPSALSLCLFLCIPLSLHAQQGTLQQRSLTLEKGLRTYELYVPANYTAESAWPLVISFHGYDLHASFQRQVDRLDLASDLASEGFLVAYPDGLLIDDPFNEQGMGWNFDGDVAPQDDIAFTQALIDDISASFTVNPARIHATGWSSGAQMVWNVACHLSDRIASVAAVAGIMDEASMEACAADRPVSVLLIHGTADIFWPQEGAYVKEYAFASPDHTVNFWAAHSGANASPCLYESNERKLKDLTGLDASTVTEVLYSTCDKETEVLYYRIDRGGHTWPGGSWPAHSNNGAWPVFLGPVNRDLEASREILGFFGRNPMPPPPTGLSATEPHLEGTDAIAVFPNPFHGTATVSVHVSRPGPVRVEVYDVLGRQRAVLLDEVVPAGTRQITLEAVPWPNGIYLLRLRTSSHSYTRQLILAR